MFEFSPFERRGSDIISGFKALEQSLFNSSDFAADIKESPDAFIIRAELPGFDRSSVKITVEDNSLTIYAQKPSEKLAPDSKFLRRECSFGSFSRSFRLENVDVDSVHASYIDGILTVNCPKLALGEPQTRQIKID